MSNLEAEVDFSVEKIDIASGFWIVKKFGMYFLGIKNTKGFVELNVNEKVFNQFKNMKSQPDSAKVEIEKKYLVKYNYIIKDYTKTTTIQQFYILKNEDSSIRCRNLRGIDFNTFIFTFKKGKGIKKIEEEFELTNNQFFDLKQINISNFISKTRYDIPIGDGLIAELDKFHGKFVDRIFVEVEFKTEKEANDFNPPSWFGEDVTNNPRYLNIFMAFQ